MQTWSATASGALLVVLWAWESIGPALAPRATWARRGRHIALGALNACVALLVASALVVVSQRAQSEQLGILRWLEVPTLPRLVLALLLLDAWNYVLHIAAHYVPWLWRVHAVHHNADVLEATVAMRFHSLETLWTGLATIPFAVVLGISVEHVALYHALLLPVSLFHHSDVLLTPSFERVLRLFLVTPGLHRVHHSRWTPQTNSNFGAILPVWDRLFGTLRIHHHPERIRVGLDGYTDAEIEHLGQMLRTPMGPSRSGYGQADEPDESVAAAAGYCSNSRGTRAADHPVPYSG